MLQEIFVYWRLTNVYVEMYTYCHRHFVKTIEQGIRFSYLDGVSRSNVILIMEIIAIHEITDSTIMTYCLIKGLCVIR